MNVTLGWMPVLQSKFVSILKAVMCVYAALVTVDLHVLVGMPCNSQI